MADFPIIPGDSFTSEQLAMLDAPMNAQSLKERIGAGGAKLKYIDGRTAIETANRIFGKGKWGFRITSRTHERIEKNDGTYQEYFTADIELYVAGNPFPFPGDGIGGVKSNTVEGIEMARKDAVTDALKRALCYYGSQFGLDLRDKDGEALVDMGEGVLVQVKEVQINKTGDNTIKPQAAARINGAQQQRQIAEPQSNASKVVDSQPPIPTVATLRKIAAQRLDDKAFETLRGKMQPLYKGVDLFIDDNWTEKHCQHAYAMLKRAIENAKQQEPVGVGASSGK